MLRGVIENANTLPDDFMYTDYYPREIWLDIIMSTRTPQAENCGGTFFMAGLGGALPVRWAAGLCHFRPLPEKFKRS
jgi:hypothetical protein